MSLHEILTDDEIARVGASRSEVDYLIVLTALGHHHDNYNYLQRLGLTKRSDESWPTAKGRRYVRALIPEDEAKSLARSYRHCGKWADD